MTPASSFLVPDGSRRTLAALVHEHLGLSHRAAKELIETGGITVDGRVAADPVRRPPGGARVEAPAGTAARGPRPRREQPIEGPGFRVIHLDGDLVVVEKAPGIVTIPTGKPDANDPPLVARLLSALQVAGHRVPELHVVHRIDRDTSGSSCSPARAPRPTRCARSSARASRSASTSRGRRGCRGRRAAGCTTCCARTRARCACSSLRRRRTARATRATPS